MAEAVVHTLEPVQVHQQDRTRFHLALARPDRLLQPLLKERSVGQPGQRIVQRLVLQRFGLRLALRYVAKASDHEALRPEPSNVELHRERRAIFPQARGLVASHFEEPLLGPQVGAQLRLDLRAQRFRDQTDELLADDLIHGVAEEPLGRRVVGANHQALIERDDAVRDVVKDGSDPVAAAPQFVFRPAPLDEVADLAPDVSHDPQRCRIEGAPVVAEERDHPGDLPAIGDRKRELGVQATACGGGGTLRIRVRGHVLDRSGSASRPYPT